MRTIEKEPIDVEDAATTCPSLVCGDCREDGSQLPLMVDPAEGQWYRCNLCLHVWRIPVHEPGYWVREWRKDPVGTIVSLIWILVLLSSFVGVVIGACAIIISHKWADSPPHMFGVLGIALIVWLIGVTILAKVFTLIENGIHYVRGEEKEV